MYMCNVHANGMGRWHCELHDKWKTHWANTYMYVSVCCFMSNTNAQTPACMCCVECVFLRTQMHIHAFEKMVYMHVNKCIHACKIHAYRHAYIDVCICIFMDSLCMLTYHMQDHVNMNWDTNLHTKLHAHHIMCAKCSNTLVKSSHNTWPKNTALHT